MMDTILGGYSVIVTVLLIGAYLRGRAMAEAEKRAKESEFRKIKAKEEFAKEERIRALENTVSLLSREWAGFKGEGK